MINTEQFWRTTGAKFTGNDTEWEEVYTGCDKQWAWTDEEGYFDSFLCIVDMKECKKDCFKHHVKLNPDVKEFVDNLNKKEKNL